MPGPSDVMRAWFRRVWCERDASAIDELLAPDGEVYGIGPDPLVGPEGFRAFHAQIFAAFSEVRLEVVDAVDAGEKCYVRCRGELTLRGAPRPFEGGSLCIVRDGTIRRAWNYWDFLGLMAAMGSLPADAFARACAGASFAAKDARRRA